jgi:hypothetical protein
MVASEENARQKSVVLLDALLCLPLILVSAIKGKKLRPMLAEMTGLSETRIARGNLDRLSAAAKRRVALYARAQAIEEGRRNGLSSEESESRISLSEELSNDPWELFAWLLMYCEADKIPYGRIVGRSHGRTVLSLFEAAKGEHFEAFRSGLRPELIEEILVRGEHAGQIQLERYQAAFESATTWECLFPLLSIATEVWLLDFLSAMDAEWGLLFFGRIRPAPYFLWVAPMTPISIDSESVIKTRRNLLHLPARRLLQFSHALMVGKFRGAWPAKPAGRALLGLDTDRPEALIGNYFDGTKILRVADYLQMWNEMYQRLSGKTSDADCPPEPMAMLHVALLWQRLLVETESGMKLKSFTILNEKLYQALWRSHLSQLVGQPSSDVYDWPDFLVNQSLSPSSAASCQS